MEFKISPNQITRLLIFITIAIGFASLSGQFYVYFLNGDKLSGVVRMFDLNEEQNIPTLVTGLILLFCSLLLEFVALAKQRENNRYSAYWHGLAITFIYLSFDELLELHEKINSILNRIVQSTGQRLDILNILLVLIFILVYFKFLLHLPKKIKRFFVLAFACVVIGGVGIELLGVCFFPNIYHQESLISEIITTIEECFEILGLTIFIHGILLYLNSFVTDIHINIVGSEKKRFQQ
ncbi:hypothetical protein [Anabaena azotica]|uniref:Uncharacterized protein n=1 Tax=Anabaena azotica FACHB-119 TaxID=947527 RepID=A0ABR8D2H2_9NOST|nr:hypothetical protein [Anabaena azotica]MBD2500465.1 hypothetical protein [Anabaena azotica FACHB-119]